MAINELLLVYWYQISTIPFFADN